MSDDVKDQSLSGTSLTLTEAQFRKILMVFAITLAIAGIWTLISELARAPLIGFPIDQNYQSAADQRWKSLGVCAFPKRSFVTASRDGERL